MSELLTPEHIDRNIITIKAIEILRETPATLEEVKKQFRKIKEKSSVKN